MTTMTPTRADVADHMTTWRRYHQHWYLRYHISGHDVPHQCSSASQVVLNAARRWYGCTACGRTHFCGTAAAQLDPDPCPVRESSDSYAVCAFSGAVLVDRGPELAAGTFEESVEQAEQLYATGWSDDNNGTDRRLLVADARRLHRRAQFSSSTALRRTAHSALVAAHRLSRVRLDDPVVVAVAVSPKKRSAAAAGLGGATAAAAAAAGPAKRRAVSDDNDGGWRPADRDIDYWSRHGLDLVLVGAIMRLDASVTEALKVGTLPDDAATEVLRTPPTPLAELCRMDHDSRTHASRMMPMPSIMWRQGIRDLLGRAVAWGVNGALSGSGLRRLPVPSPADLDWHADRLIRWLRLLVPHGGGTVAVAVAPDAITAVAVYLWYLATTTLDVTDASGWPRTLYVASPFFVALAEERLGTAFWGSGKAADATPLTYTKAQPRAVVAHSMDLAMGGAPARDVLDQMTEDKERDRKRRNEHKAASKAAEAQAKATGVVHAGGPILPTELDEGRPSSIAFAPEERCTPKQIKALYDLLSSAVSDTEVSRDGLWFSQWFRARRYQCWPPLPEADVTSASSSSLSWSPPPPPPPA
jgi:hypothetical protein